jgi:hypothetical protein
VRACARRSRCGLLLANGGATLDDAMLVMTAVTPVAVQRRVAEQGLTGDG